jgi:hypothetical protein
VKPSAKRSLASSTATVFEGHERDKEQGSQLARSQDQRPVPIVPIRGFGCTAAFQSAMMNLIVVLCMCALTALVHYLAVLRPIQGAPRGRRRWRTGRRIQEISALSTQVVQER